MTETGSHEELLRAGRLLRVAGGPAAARLPGGGGVEAGGLRSAARRSYISSSNAVNGGTLESQKPARPPCWSTST